MGLPREGSLGNSYERTAAKQSLDFMLKHIYSFTTTNAKVSDCTASLNTTVIYMMNKRSNKHGKVMQNTPLTYIMAVTNRENKVVPHSLSLVSLQRYCLL